jgi:hypothetical protein
MMPSGPVMAMRFDVYTGLATAPTQKRDKRESARLSRVTLVVGTQPVHLIQYRDLQRTELTE